MQEFSEQHCFHCGLKLVEGSIFYTPVLGQARPMCCPGCQAVAQAIVDNGLESYYQFRTEKALKGDPLLDSTLEKLKAYDHPDIQQEFVVKDGAQNQIQLTVEGISCAACGWLIEKQLSNLEGISRIGVNVSARRATISWQEDKVSLSDIIKRIEQIGYHALPFQPDKHEASFRRENKLFLKRLGLSGLMSMQVMMLAVGLYFGLFGDIEAQTKHYFHVISLILTTPVVIYSGYGFYSSAFNALRLKSVNMDVSVTIAIWGTYLSSGWATYTQQGDIYFESVCMFIFLLLISRFLEHRSRYLATQISANMIKYIPLTATLLNQGQTTSCLAKHLKPGDTVLVKPGETIPVDAQVLSGHGQVDEAMLTGESGTVSKQSGDTVFGGTINQQGTLTLQVLSELKYALVNQILRLQEMALASKPKAAIYADTASRFFVVIVLAITAVSYTAWLWIDPSRAFWIAIAILVATCPCALSLATPSALTSAMAKLNKSGILLKRADVLDQLPDVDILVFDKTGTLTDGHFSLSTMSRSDECDLSNDQIVEIVTALERFSAHPIATAFSEFSTTLHVDKAESVVGKGISGIINGTQYKVGSADFIGYAQDDRSSSLAGNIFLARQDTVLAGLQVEDELKPEAGTVLASFVHQRKIILSGDKKLNVEPVARILGNIHYEFNHDPMQKMAFLKSLQREGNQVLMVGDGINDAPVLAQADVSIAVGSAADMAKRSADIILLGNNLTPLTQLLPMAKKVRVKIKQNMAWAIGYNALILPLAVTGYLSPWMAVIGMSVSSIIVVVNSVRLLR